MEKNFRFFRGLFYVEILGGQNRYGLECTVVINPPELPKMMKLEIMHVASAGV